MDLNTMQDFEYGIADEFTSHFTSVDEFIEYYGNPDTPGVQFGQSSNNGTIPIVLISTLIIFILFGWLSRDSGALENLSTFGVFKKLVLVFVLLYAVVNFKAIQLGIRIRIAKDIKSNNWGTLNGDSLTGTALFQYLSISSNIMANFQEDCYLVRLWRNDIISVFTNFQIYCQMLPSHNNFQQTFDSTAIT